MTQTQKFSTIIAKWLGKRVDYDKAYGAQCVDWVREFAKEMYESIGTFWGSALNGWNTGCPFGSKWKRIKNTPKAIPTAGSIVFFGKTSFNKYGHVAVVDQGCTATVLKVIEQNFGNGDGDGKNSDSITRRSIPYLGSNHGDCLGWFSHS